MKPFDIVADESVDYSIIKLLRESGFIVYSIAESVPSITDADVLKIAVKNKSLLITEDKDFGELVHRFNMKHCGILLIRLIKFSSAEKASLVLLALNKHLNRLMNVFSVLDNRKIRTRK
jgi:predicted nuclease of predicted toxin-antitoxin system